MLRHVCPQGALLPLSAVDRTRRRQQQHRNRSGTVVSGREAELKCLHRGEMTHGDLMSQAEDVADQVSYRGRDPAGRRRCSAQTPNGTLSLIGVAWR